MDTGNLVEPLLPVNLPDKLLKQISEIEEENFTFDTVYEGKYDGKYNVIVEFDTRPMKTYAFYRELMSKEQDRTGEESDLLVNLLPMCIKNIRIWKIWEDSYKLNPFSISDSSTTGNIVYSEQDAAAQAGVASVQREERVLRSREEFYEAVDEMQANDRATQNTDYIIGYDAGQELTQEITTNG